MVPRERTTTGLQKISAKLEKLFKARQFVEAGEYERALELYLSSLTGSVGNMQDLALESCLTVLLERYPAARESLNNLRDELAEKIVGGFQSHAVIEEWLALSLALGEEEPDLVLLEKMRSANSDSQMTLSHSLVVVRHSLDRYLSQKKYQRIEPYFDKLGLQFLRMWVEVESRVLFPGSLDKALSSYVDGFRADLVGDAALLFEASLGLNRDFVADELVRKIFAVASDAESFSLFINAARRAGCSERAHSVLELARQQLSPREFEKLQTS